jgi:hypothetical protein
MSSQRVQVVSDERRESPQDKCIACRSKNVTPFFEIARAPVQCNALWPTYESALDAPVGEIRLGFCSACGHISNLAYNPSLMQYTQAYENSLHFSPRFREYLDELIAELDRTYSLQGKRVLDVGCGSGILAITAARRSSARIRCASTAHPPSAAFMWGHVPGGGVARRQRSRERARPS